MPSSLPTPSLMYQFQVVDQKSNELTNQVENFDLDMTKNLIHVTARQPLDDGAFIRYIGSLPRTSTNLSLSMLNSNGKVESNIIFLGAKVINHKLSYSYAESDIARHSLTFKFKDFITTKEEKSV